MPELIALSRLTILRLLAEQFALWQIEACWPPSIYPVRKVSSVLWIGTFNNFGFFNTSFAVEANKARLDIRIKKFMMIGREVERDN